ncbi:MAG: hypothetical protein BMS9Abin12_2342 [Acidimicrobiia bacterium]|nr:MAG: hypothetical protein BMS9Abin12_2342 [Acidimicrobiia bacterium]
MTEVRAAGISIDLRPGWEADIRSRQTAGFGQDDEESPTIMHVANFQLPPDRGDYGGILLTRMGQIDVFISLIDFGPLSDDQQLFSYEGVPLPLTSEDFDPDTITRAIPNRSAAQLFFQAEGRGFSLYIVVGSHRDRAELIPAINEALSSIRFEPQ